MSFAGSGGAERNSTTLLQEITPSKPLLTNMELDFYECDLRMQVCKSYLGYGKNQ